MHVTTASHITSHLSTHRHCSPHACDHHTHRHSSLTTRRRPPLPPPFVSQPFVSQLRSASSLRVDPLAAERQPGHVPAAGSLRPRHRRLAQADPWLAAAGKASPSVERAGQLLERHQGEGRKGEAAVTDAAAALPPLCGHCGDRGHKGKITARRRSRQLSACTRPGRMVLQAREARPLITHRLTTRITDPRRHS